ncbi:MAG: M4 family metallopeptidase [Saprospiraceae bacterium]
MKTSVVQQDGSWIELLPDARIQTDQFFNNFKDDLGLDEAYHFELIEESTDKLGFSHYRYQEHFNGYPIEGGIYMLHVKDGLVKKANGKLIRAIPESGQVAVSAANALELAKAHTGADVFYWEMPQMEARIKHIKGDPAATFFPKADLVYVDEQFAQVGDAYRLAWKYILYAAGGHGKETVFVDAVTGKIVCTLEGCHSNSVEGTAKTRYHGIQTIVTDSVSPTEYRLIDATRGEGVETYDMNENVDDYDLAVDFVDEDNYWDNANAQLDNAATDVHWGSEMTYDYFLEDHGRDSYDGNGSKLVSYVHYDVDLSNAFWNGTFATYGDGMQNPLTSIDVVGHEITHGVTQFSAGLIYQGESGALNESFSDIFGTAIESFALGIESDWILGRENFSLRNMSNPKSTGDPDTYSGVNWASTSSGADNGGVHTNSGVQNYWFYLLSEGGTGVNDNGDSYTIDSLGMEIAAAIAYRNLTVYLTPSSGYIDARTGSIQAAEDLYGECSSIALEVAEAWYAVGVGSEVIGPDFQFVEVLSPVNASCDLGSTEQVSMAFRFNPTGCGLTVPAGEELELSYSLNGEAPIVETRVLDTTLTGGELFTHDFMTPADLSEPGLYEIDFSVRYMGDLISSNDVFVDHSLTNPITLEGADKLSFETPSMEDSIFVTLGSNARAVVSRSARNTGSRGFFMNSFGATLENTTVFTTEAENYTDNFDFISKLCSCVDLAGWDDAYLNFDLRQTYSTYYMEELSLDLSFMIAMRATIDGVQVGNQYHPETNGSDEYKSHVIDVSSYAGSMFTVCFEGAHYVNDEETDDGDGDKSMLDNIFFSESIISSVAENTSPKLTITPNPTSGVVQVETDAIGMQTYQVIDMIGQVVQSGTWLSNGISHTLDLSEFAKGTYMLSITTNEGQVVQKIVVQ